jgi:hypothetical protein
MDLSYKPRNTKVEPYQYRCKNSIAMIGGHRVTAFGSIFCFARAWPAHTSGNGLVPVRAGHACDPIFTEKIPDAVSLLSIMA